jgi:hypothetical protein
VRYRVPQRCPKAEVRAQRARYQLCAARAQSLKSNIDKPPQLVLGWTDQHARANTVALLQERLQDPETLRSSAWCQSTSTIHVFIEAAKFVVNRRGNLVIKKHLGLVQRNEQMLERRSNRARVPSHWRWTGTVREVFGDKPSNDIVCEVARGNPGASHPAGKVRDAIQVHRYGVVGVASPDEVLPIAGDVRSENAVAQP